MTGDGFDYERAILQCSQGDRSALQQIYDREAGWFLGVAARIVRDRQIAEDVVQEAFLLIWSRAGTFKPELGSARGWMYTIVRHRALQTVRKSAGDRVTSMDDPDRLPDRSEAGNDATDIPTRMALERCLGELEPVRRQYIEAAFVDGFTHAELARRFDKPLGTIKSLIRRGLASLRECLE